MPVPSTPTPKNKGRSFELDVEHILRELTDVHGEKVTVRNQPRIDLNDGQYVISDFEFEVELPHELGLVLIECQDRQRSEPTILHKIKYIKGVSPRNRFIFVHAEPLSEATKNALDADGVMHMSLSELQEYVDGLKMTLDSLLLIAQAKKKRGYGYDKPNVVASSPVEKQVMDMETRRNRPW